jgi:hypothetical protein
MKTIPFLTISLILFTLLSACNADEKKIVIMEDLNNPSREEIRAKTQSQPNDTIPLSKEVGIGAARKQFDQAYGQNDGDLEIARYQREFMIVTFEKHRAVNIQYQFAYKSGEDMSKEEINTYIRERIPKDAVELNRMNENTSQKMIEYRSDSLRKTVANQSFRGDEPGNFVVIYNQNEQGEISVTVALGSMNSQ